jgi:hypothetical protein
VVDGRLLTVLAGVAHAVGLAAGDHQRNAKLQLTVMLADAEPVAGLYARIEYRRPRVRPSVERPSDV